MVWVYAPQVEIQRPSTVKPKLRSGSNTFAMRLPQLRVVVVVEAAQHGGEVLLGPVRRRVVSSARRDAAEWPCHGPQSGNRWTPSTDRVRGGQWWSARSTACPLLHPPGRLVRPGQEIEERLRRRSASGPRTPAPDQTPVASSSRATTGLTAVCQTTHWAPYSRHRVGVVDHVVEVHLARLAVLAGAGHPDPGAGGAVHRSPRYAGSGRHAATTSRGLTSTARRVTAAGRAAPYRDRRGAVQAELVQRLEHVDELAAEAVLEGHPLGVDPARHQQHLLVLDVARTRPGRCRPGSRRPPAR